MYPVKLTTCGDTILQFPVKSPALRRGNPFRSGEFPHQPAEQVLFMDKDAVIIPVAGKTRRVEHFFIGQFIPGRAGKNLSPVIEKAFPAKVRRTLFRGEKAPGDPFPADKSDEGTPGTILEELRHSNMKKRVGRIHIIRTGHGAPVGDHFSYKEIPAVGLHNPGAADEQLFHFHLACPVIVAPATEGA